MRSTQSTIYIVNSTYSHRVVLLMVEELRNEIALIKLEVDVCVAVCIAVLNRLDFAAVLIKGLFCFSNRFACFVCKLVCC